MGNRHGTNNDTPNTMLLDWTCVTLSVTQARPVPSTNVAGYEMFGPTPLVRWTSVTLQAERSRNPSFHPDRNAFDPKTNFPFLQLPQQTREKKMSRPKRTLLLLRPKRTLLLPLHR